MDTTDVVVNKQISILLKESLINQGMPRVALAKKVEEKRELLHYIYQIYLLRDVKNYVKNEDSVDFVDCNKL